VSDTTMTDDQAKAEVSRLLLKRAEMRRLGIELPPQDLMLLKRLMYRLGMNNVKLQRRESLLRLARAAGVKRYSEPVEPTQQPSGPLAPWRNAPTASPKKATKALQVLKDKAALVPVTDEPLPQVPRPANVGRTPVRRQVDASVRNVPGGFDLNTRSGRRAFRDYLSDTDEDRDLDRRVQEQVDHDVDQYESDLDSSRLREIAEDENWTPEVILDTIRQEHPEAAEAVDQWHRYNSYRPQDPNPGLFDPYSYGLSNQSMHRWHDGLADPYSTEMEESLARHIQTHHPHLDLRAINRTLNRLANDRRDDMESAIEHAEDRDRQWFAEHYDSSDIEDEILHQMYDEMEQEGRWEERDEEPEEDDEDQTPQLNVVNSNEPPQQLPAAEPKPLPAGPQFGRWYGDDRVHTYRFQTPSGRPFTIDIGHYNEPGTTIDNLTFNDDRHSFADTGKGEAAAVFDQVASAVSAYMQAKKPHILAFSAASTDGSATGGKSRQNLYTALIKRIGQLDPNYGALAVPLGGGGTKQFVVFDRSKVDDVERLLTSKFGQNHNVRPEFIMSRRRETLYRLGMNNVKLQRRESLLRLARAAGVKRYSEPVDPKDMMFRIVGHAMDHPGDLAVWNAATDEINDHHPGEPSVEAFRRWLGGESWVDSGLLDAIGVKNNQAGSIYTMVGPEILSGRTDLAAEVRPVRGSHASGDVYADRKPIPMFAKNRGDSMWHLRKWAHPDSGWVTLADRKGRGRNIKPPQQFTSEQVARQVYATDGPKGLIHMMVGSHHWRPEKNTDQDGNFTTRDGVPDVRNSRKRELLLKLARKINGMRKYKLIVPEEQNLFPEERDIIIGGSPGKQKKYVELVGQGLKDRSGDMPGLSEIKSLAEVGEPVRGSYEEMHKFVSHLMRSPGDANRWVMANAVLSPQTPWEQHTAGAVEALGVWHAAGRPTDAKSLEDLFGRTQRNERGTLQLDNRFPRKYKGPDLYSGYKAEQLKRIFSADQGESENVGFGDFGGGEGLKVPNFGMAFVDPRGVPVDTHMAKLLSNLDEGFSRKLVEKIVRGSHPDKAINSALLDSQKGLAGKKHNWPYAMAYKTLINKAAADLGWEPRQVQEAVWTTIVGVMVAKHLGAGPKSHEILKYLSRKAIRGGWSLEAIIRRPEVLRDLERLGISSKRITNAIASSAKYHESVSRGPSRTSDPSALESAAARLAGEVPSAGRNIRDVIVRGSRKSQLRPPR